MKKILNCIPDGVHDKFLVVPDEHLELLNPIKIGLVNFYRIRRVFLEENPDSKDVILKLWDGERVHSKLDDNNTYKFISVSFLFTANLDIGTCYTIRTLTNGD